MVAAEAGAEAVQVGEEAVAADIAAVVVEATGKAAAEVEAAGKGAVEAAAHKVVANLAVVSSVAAGKAVAARAAGKAASQPHIAAAGTREVIEAPVRLTEVNRRAVCPEPARRAAPLMAHHNNSQGSIKLVAVEALQTPAAIRRDPVVVDPAALQLAAGNQAAASILAPRVAVSTAVDNVAAVNTATLPNTALAITTTVAAALHTTAAAPVVAIDPRTWPAAPDRTVTQAGNMAVAPVATAATTAASTSIITADIRAIIMAADIPSRMGIGRRITAVGITATGMAIGDIRGDFGRPAGIGAVGGDWASAGELAPASRWVFRSARRGPGVITPTTIHTGLRQSPCRSISITRNRSS